MLLATKVGKILSRQKSPDRFTMVSLFKPKKLEDQEHGLLYFVIEILSPDPSLARIAKRIESVMIEEYYTDFETGIEAFEKSLKRVNQELAQIAEEGEVGWIGRINGVIASLEKNALHITQTGTVEGYLIREESISHITSDLAGSSERPSPTSTFGSVASGTISVGDKLLFSTSELFYHFSIDDLRRIVAKFSPAAAATYIVKSLHREEVESINALILECIAQGDIPANESGATTEWIGQAPPTIEEYAEKVSPALGFLKNISQKGIEKSKSVYHDQIALTVSKISAEASRKVSERISTYQSAQESGIDEATPANSLFSQAQKPTPGMTATEQKQQLVVIVTSASKSLLGSVQRLTSRTKEHSQIFVIASLVLIAVLAVSGSYTFKNKKAQEKRDAVQSQYEVVRTKTDSAIKAQKLGDDKKARELLIAAQTEVTPLLQEKYLVEDIKQLALDIDIEVEKLFNILRYEDLPVFTDFSTFDETAKVSGLFKSPAGLISFDRERKNLLRFNSELGVTEKVPTAYFDGDYQSMTDGGDGTIVFATQSPNSIYAINLTSLEISQVAQVAGEAWPKIKDVATFYKNLYTLVPSENQIYKHINLIGNFGSKVPYIVDAGGVDLSHAVSIAIDGAVYVLMDNGEVHQYMSGVKTNFKISGLPILNDNTDRKKTGVSSLLTPVKINVARSGDIYIADAGASRIVVFDREGVYKKQYVSPHFADLSSYWIDEDDAKIYILAGTKVYQLPL